MSRVIGYCSKSLDCDYLDIVENCRYYYMDLGITAYFLRKTGEDEDTIRCILRENYVYLEKFGRTKIQIPLQLMYLIHCYILQRRNGIRIIGIPYYS